MTWPVYRCHDVLSLLGDVMVCCHFLGCHGVLSLLGDVMVRCTLCGQGIRAGDYDTHECSQFGKLQQLYG